jgi:hypothetical protein
MRKYGDNRWWISEDPRERAYYQINEDILLMSFNKLHKDIEILLNRPVYTHEFAFPKIKEEAKRAWTYNVGATSDKECQERFEASLQDLKDMGKEIIVIEVPAKEVPNA